MKDRAALFLSRMGDDGPSSSKKAKVFGSLADIATVQRMTVCIFIIAVFSEVDRK